MSITCSIHSDIFEIVGRWREENDSIILLDNKEIHISLLILYEVYG